MTQTGPHLTSLDSGGGCPESSSVKASLLSAAQDHIGWWWVGPRLAHKHPIFLSTALGASWPHVLMTNFPILGHCWTTCCNMPGGKGEEKKPASQRTPKPPEFSFAAP